MKPRSSLLAIALILMAVSLLTGGNYLIKTISITISIFATGIFFGIKIKSYEVNYKIKNKVGLDKRRELNEQEKDFLKALSVE